MQAEGAVCTVRESTSCCYAVQDKVWVSGPEIPWEIYTVLADADGLHGDDGMPSVSQNAAGVLASAVAAGNGSSCC